MVGHVDQMKQKDLLRVKLVVGYCEWVIYAIALKILLVCYITKFL